MTSFANFVEKNPIQTPQPGFFTKNIVNPIKSAFNSGVQQVKEGYQQASHAPSPLQGAEGILKAGSGLATAITSPVTGPVSNVLNNAVINPIANKVAENPSVQKFANSKTGQVTSRVAEDLSNAGNIAGTVAAGMQIHPIFSRVNSLLNPDTIGIATAARETAATEGVKSVNEINQQVGQYKSNLGTNFEQGAQNIAKNNPELKLSLTNKQLENLNNLRESKSFSLPENLDNSSEGASISGSKFNVGKSVASQIEGLQNEAATKLDPMQTQDLIRRLNKLTFDAKASGDLKINQQTIGLTNELKTAASQAFGPEWNKVYSDYAQGAHALEKINDIVSPTKDATASDVYDSLNKIKDFGKTPEGKIILQQAVDEFKKTSGIDLTDKTQVIQKILEADDALEKAGKPGVLKQMFDPKYLGRRAVGTAIVGGGATIFLYPLYREIRKILTGQ